MSDIRFTYELTEDVLDGMSSDERLALLEAWNLASSPVANDTENGKAEVKRAVLSQIHEIRVDRAPIFSSQRTARIFSLKLRWVSIAAAVVVAVGLVLSPSPDQHRAESGTDLVKSISLLDGTTIQLAPGSRLSVLDGFAEDHRKVILHGEAFFDVAEGSTPFVVKTFDVKMTVLGTGFGVRAWPSSLAASTRVVVESGRVSVAADASVVLLTAGFMTQKLIGGSELTEPVATNAGIDLLWRKGGFTYDNEFIGNVLDDFERRFGVDIKAPASIRLRRISISKKSIDSLPDVLGDVAATVGVRYRANANGFEMYLN